MGKREKKIAFASWISIAGNGILSVLKIVVGLATNSLAVVGDGIDSASDIVVSIITLITAKIISRPPDKKYAYGYEKADSIASKVLSFFIFFAGAQLLYTSVKKLITGEITGIPGKWAIYVTLLSVVVKVLLAVFQKRMGKKTNSSMLISNAKNMQNDVFISVAVLFGLLFTVYFNLPILDPIAASIVSLWIMKVGFDVFMDANTELMDGVKDPGVYHEIFEAASNTGGVKNPHRVRSRQIGSMHMIQIDIEVDGDLTLYEAHEIAHRVEDNIKKRVKKVYDIVVHVEPIGDVDKKEKFGLKPEDMEQ
jgi:cation diffusion facilitator family transporter